MKVYILKWTITSKIGAVYSDYEKAIKIANKSNKKKTWRHKLYDFLHGTVSKWIVVSFDLKE